MRPTMPAGVLRQHADRDACHYDGIADRSGQGDEGLAGTSRQVIANPLQWARRGSESAERGRIVAGMVIRILRTRVRPASVPEFRVRALAKVADARKVPGVVDVHLGNQADGNGYEFVFISRWQTVDALYAWAGGQDLLARPIYFDGLEESIVEFDIQHYIDVEDAD